MTLRTLIVLGISARLATSTAAQSYVIGVPDPARVIAAYSGPDSIDRTARQVAALWVIQTVLQELTGDRIASDMEHRRPGVTQTPAERRLREAYRNAGRGVRLPELDQVATQRSGASPLRREWDARTSTYMADEQFKGEVLGQFFTPEWVAAYAAAHARRVARQRSDDSTATADSRARAEEERPHLAPPMPANESRFLAAFSAWCRERPLAHENPIARDQAGKAWQRRLATLVGNVGPVTNWTGLVKHIESNGDSASLRISIDTVSSYQLDDDLDGPVLLDASFAEGTPIHAAASKLARGQWVSFSGRGLTSFGAEVRDPEVSPPCRLSLGITLLALRPAASPP